MLVKILLYHLNSSSSIQWILLFVFDREDRVR